MTNPTYMYLSPANLFDSSKPALEFDPNVWSQCYHREVFHTHPKEIPLNATVTQIQIIQSQAKKDLEAFYEWLQRKDHPAFNVHPEIYVKDALNHGIRCCEEILRQTQTKNNMSCCAIC